MSRLYCPAFLAADEKSDHCSPSLTHSVDESNVSLLSSLLSSCSRQTLCRTQQAITTFGMRSTRDMSSLLSRLNLPLRMANTRSIIQRAAESVLLKMCSRRPSWPVSLYGTSSRSVSGYARSPSKCVSGGNDCVSSVSRWNSSDQCNIHASCMLLTSPA